MATTRVIADSSIWIDHFNKGDAELARLLRRRSVTLHAMIMGEIALGSLANRHGALGELGELPQAEIASHDEVMALIEDDELFSRGIGYVDVHLLVATRRLQEGRLWTRDKRLRSQAERLGIAADLPMTPSAPRLPTLDFVRGVAVMGILLMNIQSFALPEAAYSNPRADGGWHGADLAVWWLEAVLVDGKMRGLFSWLFGASALLVADRATAAGESGLQVHYRRMAWLALFGLAHLTLVWDGDILLHYALVGSVAFAFRNRPTHALVTAAVLLIVAQVVIVLPVPIALSEAVASVASGHPNAVAVQDLPGWRDQFGVPSSASIADAVALHRGPYPALLAYRLREAPGLVYGTLASVGLETLAYMLLGMAALRSGLLAGAWSRAAYRRGALIGFGLGVPAMLAITAWEWSSGFDLRAVAWAALIWTAPVRAAMIAGWVCLLVPLAGSGALRGRVAAAGRMAFSNYLGTSLICAGLFDGLGLFGGLGRAALIGVVVAVWAVMLLWSEAWLRRFRYGPLEWLWRSLARRSLQPMRLI